eukprot:m.94988 g.94988  ORF g.94988 m.94988 type:complete len:51 (-) comp13033_c0_seq20:2251-2403(-)
MTRWLYWKHAAMTWSSVHRVFGTSTTIVQAPQQLPFALHGTQYNITGSYR